MVLRGKGDMDELFKNNPSYVVSEAALEKKEHFSINEILDAVKDRIIKYFNNSLEALKRFITEQLDAMCEFGLIGKTSLYYFPVNV